MELKKYEKIETSQWGEDGVITEIFSRIGSYKPVCIEFGAWDGKHLSNCWNLWYNEGWDAILLESDNERAAALKQSTIKLPQVQCLSKKVEINGENSLDAILDNIQLTKQIDLLSIDIDSDDYAIFESLNRSPRVIVIEYNPTIPPHIDLVQKPGSDLGNSISAICKLAQKKDYKLAHVTYTNVILVNDQDWEKLNISEVDYFKAFPYEKLTCVINTYSGDTILSQPPPYNGGYLAKVNNSVKHAIKSKFISKDEFKKPTYITDGQLVYCEIKKK